MRKTIFLGALALAANCAVSSAPVAAQHVSAGVSCQRNGFSSLSECESRGGNTINGTYSPGSRLSTSVSGKADDIIPPGPANGFSANAAARADYGLVGVAANAALTSQLLTLGQISDTYGVVSSSFGAWRDLFSVEGTGLAFGELVRVRATQIVDIHDVSAVFSPRSLGYAVAETTFSAWNGLAGIAEARCIAASSGPYCNPSTRPLAVGRNELTSEFEFRVGVANEINFGLATFAVGELRNSFEFGLQGFNLNVDAFNTAHTYLTVLTPGATLTSASGHDYSLPAIAAIPEPASWAMMIAGFGFVGGALRSGKVRRSRLRRAV